MTDGVRQRRSGAGICTVARVVLNDLDETLTVSAPVLTPPMRQARMEVPSVESDSNRRSGVMRRLRRGAEAGFGGAGTEVGARGPAQGGEPAWYRRGLRPAGELLVFGQAPPARPAAGQRATTCRAAVETARPRRAVM